MTFTRQGDNSPQLETQLRGNQRRLPCGGPRRHGWHMQGVHRTAVTARDREGPGTSHRGESVPPQPGGVWSGVAWLPRAWLRERARGRACRTVAAQCTASRESAKNIRVVSRPPPEQQLALLLATPTGCRRVQEGAPKGWPRTQAPSTEQVGGEGERANGTALPPRSARPC